MSLFKPFGQEFLLTEIEAQAAEFGKRAEEIEWVAQDATVDGVAGRYLKPKDEIKVEAVAQEAAPVIEPETTAEQEAAPAPAEDPPAA